MRRQPSQRGFSIIELIVVITVLGVLAAAALPSMADFFDRKRLVSQTEAVTNLLQFARSESIKHPTSTTANLVSATISPTSPWFVGLSNGTSACTNSTTCVVSQGGTNVTRYVSATECTGCTLAIHEDTPTGTAVTTPVVMIFDLRGIVTTATTHDYYFTLSSPRGNQLSLFVSKIGRISICSPASTISGYSSCS